MERGATRVVCVPYTLSRGQPVQDLLRAALEASAALYPHVAVAVCRPLAVVDALFEVVHRLVVGESTREGMHPASSSGDGLMGQEAQSQTQSQGDGMGVDREDESVIFVLEDGQEDGPEDAAAGEASDSTIGAGGGVRRKERRADAGKMRGTV